MNTEIIQKIFNVNASTIDDIKVLLKEVKSYKDQKLREKIQELETELKEIKKAKKYWLVWEEKQEFFDKQTIWKLPVLKEVKEKNIHIDLQENNILIEWDNYHTLSVLNYTHAGKIDVIYIDPPYNTGNNDFIYNDNYVEKDDKFRHSKWLSFMNKRLKLAKNLLSETWVIFISIDDNEQAQLKLLCDEIFWRENFINNIVVKSSETSWVKMSHIDKKLPKIKEYLFLYWRNSFLTNIKPVKISKIDNIEKFKIYSKYYSKIILNIDDTPENWNILSLKDFFKWKNLSEEKILKFKIENSNRIIYRTNNKTFEKLEIDEKIKKIISANWIEYIWWEWKQMLFLSDYIEESLCDLWSDISTINLNKEILWLTQFSNWQKPLELIKRILRLSSSSTSTIFDFFAWSGTTWHAVLELNKEDGWNRKFILATNNENKICEEVTYERLKRVMTGYENQKWEKIDGLWWNLTYLKTDFIDKTKVNDDLRVRMVKRCSELLCLKENIWHEIKQTNDTMKIFERNDKYLALLFDMFYFDEFKEILKSLHKPISIYTFSHYKLSKTDFKELNIAFEIEQIPDPILEVYESIFWL